MNGNVLPVVRILEIHPSLLTAWLPLFLHLRQALKTIVLKDECIRQTSNEVALMSTSFKLETTVQGSNNPVYLPTVDLRLVRDISISLERALTYRQCHGEISLLHLDKQFSSSLMALFKIKKPARTVYYFNYYDSAKSAQHCFLVGI